MADEKVKKTKEEKREEAKKSNDMGVTVTGVSSAVLTSAGVFLLVTGTLPMFMLGGALTGAGIGGTINTATQAKNKKKCFSYKRWVGHSGIGAVGGGTYAIGSIVGAGFIAGTGIENAIAKGSLIAGKEAASIGVGGGFSYVASNRLDGRKVGPMMAYRAVRDTVTCNTERSKRPSLQQLVSEGYNYVSTNVAKKTRGPLGLLYLNVFSTHKITEGDFT